MRIFFVLFGLFFVVQTARAEERGDSLAIEQVRNEAVQLARQGNMVGSIEKMESAIAQSIVLGLSEAFINKRLRLFLANRYSNIGDFDRSIEIASKLELFYKGNGDLKNELYVKNNLGVYNQVVGRYEVAYHYFLEGWQIQKEGNDIEDQLDWLDGLSASCIELGRTEEARGYLAKAEQLLKVCPLESKDELLLYYLVNKSNHALAVGKEAEVSLVKCIALAEATGDRKGVDASLLIANLFLRQGKNQLAWEYAEKMRQLLGADQDNAAKDPYLLQAYLIQAKAELALGNYEGVLANCEKAETQGAFFQRQYLFNESKLYIGELRRENLEIGVMALYHLYEQTNQHHFLEEALIYADRAKSNLLNERWRNLKVLSNDKRTDVVKWRFKLIFQLNELEEEENKDKSIDLRNRLDSLNEVLGITEDAPFVVGDLRSFQAQLKETEVYVAYMVIDTLVFRFDIQKSQIEWHRQVLERPQDVLVFYNVLKDPTSTPQAFLKAAENLSALLPSRLLENSPIKDIHIVPDGILNHLVFDAIPLKSGGEHWNTIHYAGLDCTFSYDFSLQSSERTEEKKLPSRYIAFAPDYSLLKDWADLKNSNGVVANASDHFEGNSYIGDQASKAHFQMHSPEADLLHLYVHGVSNDSSYDASYLVLHDDKVYVDQIMSLRLKASLCVLTACEVGLGKTYHGEGITGIAWSFKAAGVKNVVQSMWKLNEQSSALLMNDFFDHLASGHSSSVALTKAKHQYLMNPEISDRQKHPYYWAGIGHYGHGAILSEDDQSGSNTGFIWAVLLVTGCLLFLWVMRNKWSGQS